MECTVKGDITSLEYFRTVTDNVNDICYVYMQRSPARNRLVNTYNVSHCLNVSYKVFAGYQQFL